MKAISLAAQSIALGQNGIGNFYTEYILSSLVVAGGTESMSNVPYYSTTQRFGSKYGNQELVDGIVKDGLWDVYNSFLMGNAAEICAKEHGFTREIQDEYAIQSYTRAQAATKAGLFADEICPVIIKGSRGKPDTVVSTDDEVKNLNVDKLKAMRPAFDPVNGTCNNRTLTL